MTARPSGPVDAERSAKPRDVEQLAADLRGSSYVLRAHEYTQWADHLFALAADLEAGRVILLPVGET